MSFTQLCIESRSNDSEFSNERMIRVALCFSSNLPTFVLSVWRHFRRNAPLCTRTCSEIDQRSGLPACRHNESGTFPDGRIVSRLAATIRPSRFVGARCRADQSAGYHLALKKI